MSAGVYFALSNKGWQQGGVGDGGMYSTDIWDRGTTGYDANFSGSSNSIKNKTNQRGVLQFVAVHQTVGDEKLWKSHFQQLLFRIVDPHDLDHQNFLLMRNEMLERAFETLGPGGYQESRDLYYEGPQNHMKNGTYPYGRYQTVPQVNYALAKAQLEEGVVLSYADVWSRVRPSGICITSESAQANADGVLGDLRAMTIGGPEKMHNVFGKGIKPGWQFGVLIKPVLITEGKLFKYRITIDGKEHGVRASTCVGTETNKAVARGYFWQLEYYCCQQYPDLQEYHCQTHTITTESPVAVEITGGYIRLGRIHYEFMETRNFFEFRNAGITNDRHLYSRDMDMCEKAPLLDVFWDPVQKFH